jgi:hypothetical protein
MLSAIKPKVDAGGRMILLSTASRPRAGEDVSIWQGSRLVAVRLADGSTINTTNTSATMAEARMMREKWVVAVDDGTGTGPRAVATTVERTTADQHAQVVGNNHPTWLVRSSAGTPPCRATRSGSAALC